MPSSKDPVVNRQKANEYRLAHPEWHRRANREWARKMRADPEKKERELANQARYRAKRNADPERRARQLEAQKQWMRDHPGYGMEWNRANPERYILKSVQSRARREGTKFDIKLEDIVIPASCPVLGIPLFWTSGKKGSANPNAPSLDRVIPALGYVRGNVRVISNRANILKGDATLAELEAIVAYVKREG